MMTNLIRSLKNSIPNIFTMFNLLSGCMAILLSFHDLALAGLLIMLAGIFDFVDGLAARLLGAYSDFGKELDSLADSISFGVAPSFVLFHLLKMSLIIKNPLFSIDQLTAVETAILASSFMPAVFSALRLARFNLENSKEVGFKGLPSPAAGIFIASLGFILFTTDTGRVQDILMNTSFLLSVNIVISVLMVIPLPMFTIKFINLRFSENKIRYIFSIPSFFLLIFGGLSMIPVIIIFYITLSLILFLIPKT